MQTDRSALFRDRHFAGKIIVLRVRWYLRFLQRPGFNLLLAATECRAACASTLLGSIHLYDRRVSVFKRMFLLLLRDDGWRNSLHDNELSVSQDVTFKQLSGADEPNTCIAGL